MKSKISKILGVVLSLALLSSLAMIAVPVSAATGPGTNTWQEVMLPETMPGIQVRILELAPNGDLYAGVVHDSGGMETMSLMKSTDGGWNWEETALDDFYLDGAFIYSIAVSPDSQTVYVGTDDGYGSYEYARIWKIEEAGEGVPVPLQTIYGIDESENLEYADYVYDLEVWSDGQYNYVLAGTDIDVLVLRDALIETWVDLDLTGAYEDGSPSFEMAVKASFSPDFESSFLVWAIIIIDNAGSGDTEFVITACNVNSPGAWGALIKPAEFVDYGTMEDDCSIYADFAFAVDFDSLTNPLMYAALAENDGSPTSDIDGNLFQIAFAQAASTQDTEFIPLLDNPGNGMCSVEVAPGVIMAGDRWDNRIVMTTDNAASWQEAIKPPTGISHTQIILAPGFTPEDGTVYATSWEEYPGYESAFSISMDGGKTFNQVGGLIDTTIDVILDMTFSPDFPAGSFMLVLTYSSDYDHISLWRTENGDEAEPVWERVFCGEDDNSWNSGNLWISESGEGDLIEWSHDGSTVMLFEEQNEQIWKSTDQAQTFTNWRDMPGSEVDIIDWVVLDGVNFYAATTDGFYAKTAYGPAIWETSLGSLNSIALQPDFDSGDDDNDTLVVGHSNGDLSASADGGVNWGTAVSVGMDSVFVAFDQMDPTTVYYATASSTVGSVSISGNVVTDNDAFEDSDEETATAESFSGIWVSPGTLDAGGNVLYAMGGTDASTKDERDVLVWGMLEFDNGIGGPYGNALCADGDVDLTGATTGDEDDIGMSDFLLVPVSGTFSDGETLTIDTANDELKAITSSIVAGRVYVHGTTLGDVGYIDMAFVNIAADNFTEDDVVVVTQGSTAWTADRDNDPSGAVLGEKVTETEGTFSDDDTPDVTAHGLLVGTVFPTIVGGTVAIQNPVIDKGTFDITWDADFGFDNGDLGDWLDDLDSYDLEIQEVIDTVPDVDASAELNRILIGEVDNEWETAPKDGAVGLWGTKGSNILWTVVNDCEIWALRDTMATSVKGLTVDSFDETSADISWAALVGAEMYEYKWDSSTDTTVDDETEATIDGLTNDTDYTVMVRVPAGYPFQSRWSSSVDFTTLESISKPANIVPDNGEQGISTMPSFVWGDIGNADHYQFQLSTDPAFGTMIVDIMIDAPVTAYTVTTAIAFDTNHYWRVRAISATGTMSDWCFSNFTP